jgi:membrane protein
VREFARRYAAVVAEALRRYSDGRFDARAAAIAYSVLCSLIPFLVTVVAVFGLVLRDEALRQRVTERVLLFLAMSSGDSGFVEQITRGLAHTSPAVGPVSLFVTLWSGTRAFSVVQQALEDVWAPEHEGRFLHRRVGDAVMLAGLILLLLASLVANTIFASAVAAGSNLLGPDARGLRWLSGAGSVLVSFGFSFTVFVLAYRLIPPVEKRWHSVLAGALPGAAAFETLKLAFALFVARFAVFSPVYGALSSVFLFLTWANWSAAILLVGAQLAAVWEHTAGGRTLSGPGLRLPLVGGLRRLWRWLGRQGWLRPRRSPTRAAPAAPGGEGTRAAGEGEVAADARRS